MRVKVKGKDIPTSFLEIEGKGKFVWAERRRKKDGVVRWGGRAEKEGWLVVLVGDQFPSPETPFWSKKGEE